MQRKSDPGKGPWKQCILLVFMLGNLAHAAENKPNQGMVFLEAQVHLRTHDIWQGYILQNQGLIVEPRLTITLAQPDRSIWYFGAGQSFHDQKTLAGASSTADTFFESNFFVGTGRPLNQDWWVNVMYLTLTSPNAAFQTNQILDLSMRYLSLDPITVGEQAFKPVPYAKVGWDLDGQLDAGTEEGTYLEIGVDNTCDLGNGAKLALPIKAGFSIENYYELGGQDQTFGFFDIGLDWSSPLPDVPVEQGQWTVHAGVHLLLVSDNVVGLTAVPINGGKKDIVYGSIGFSINY